MIRGLNWPFKRMLKPLPLVGGALALFLFFGLVPHAKADIFVQGLTAKGSLQVGSIAALSNSSVSTVELAPVDDSGRIYGVVVDPAQAAVTLDRQGQQVFVATQGYYPVLVSANAGIINVGDFISISNVAGIGAKANVDQATILGQALEAFDGQHKVVSGTGKLAIGKIIVNIDPRKNPAFKNGATVPEPLRRLGNTIAGKEVSGSRIYTALAIFVVASVVAGGLLWVGARSSLTAIGRNPLSKSSILTSLLQVVGVSITVFIIGLIGVYLLLRI